MNHFRGWMSNQDTGTITRMLHSSAGIEIEATDVVARPLTVIFRELPDARVRALIASPILRWEPLHSADISPSWRIEK